MFLYLLHDFLRVFFMSAINRYLEKPSDEKCKEMEEAWETWFGDNHLGKGNLTAENIAEFRKEFPCGDYEFKGYVCVSFFPSQILYV